MIVRCSPRDSILARELAPDDTRWSDTEWLLADVVDRLSLLVWFKTKDGSKNRNRPEPVPRPGDAPRTRKLGGTALPMDQMAKVLGWDAPAEPDAAPAYHRDGDPWPTRETQPAQ